MKLFLFLFAFLVFSVSSNLAQDKIKMYYKGSAISDSTELIEEVYARGYQYAVQGDITKMDRINALYNGGFNVISLMSKWAMSLYKIDLDPFEDYEAYYNQKNALQESIEVVNDKIIGILDDLEHYAFNKTTYNTGGVKDELTYGYNRINFGSVGRFSEGFREIEDKHDIDGLDMDKIQFNFPVNNGKAKQLDYNVGFLLGWSSDYHYVAQTFKPASKYISKIDILIKRQTPTYVEGNIDYYITNTANGIPTDIITPVRTIKSEEIGHNGELQNNFNNITPTSLYFDASTELDVDETYAVVLKYTSNIYEGATSHYRIAAVKDIISNCPKNIDYYGDGYLLKGNSNSIWTKYDCHDYYHIDHDLWFTVYYPDIPIHGVQPNIFQTVDSKNALILGYNYTYEKVAQSFTVSQTTNVTSIDSRIYKVGSTGYSDIKVSITGTNPDGTPNESNIMSEYRIPKELLPQGANNITVSNNCWLESGNYSIVLEYESSNYSTTNYYYVRGHEQEPNGPYSDGKMYKGNRYGWFAYNSQDIYFKINSTDIALNEFHDDWIDFQVYNTSLIVQDYDEVLEDADQNLKLFIYSGYQDLEYFYQSIQERYSMDWNSIAPYIDYAICGYGDHDVTATQNILNQYGVGLIGGIQNASNKAQTRLNFFERYSECSAGAMYWYGGGFENDQDFDVNTPPDYSEDSRRNNNILTNFPNPFNPTTQIKYSTKESGLVLLKVFDVLGTEVRTLVNENQDAGTHLVVFNASSLPSGIYFYRIQAGNFIDTKKMILAK